MPQVYNSMYNQSTEETGVLSFCPCEDITEDAGGQEANLNHWISRLQISNIPTSHIYKFTQYVTCLYQPNILKQMIYSLSQLSF